MITASASATATAAVVGAQTVDVAVSGTAIAAGDYSLAATQITIQDGQATGTVTLLIAADGNLEAAIETATVTISNPSSGVVLGSTVSANFTIQDDTSITLDEVSRYPGSQPTVTWQPVPGAVRYEMWFSRVFPSGQRIYSDTNVSGTSWTPPAVLDAAAYRYWVRAFDFNGNATPWSLPNTFEVRPTLIGPLNGAFTQRPTFEWEPIPLATGYTLFLRSDSGDQVITDITEHRIYRLPIYPLVRSAGGFERLTRLEIAAGQPLVSSAVNHAPCCRRLLAHRQM